MNTRMEFTPMPLCLGLTPFPVPHYLDGLLGQGGAAAAEDAGGAVGSKSRSILIDFREAHRIP
jgi:hypothetical protein